MVVLGNERKYDCFVSILACFYYGLNPKYLGITKYRYSHALKTAKNLGYTALEGYGGSGCTCTFNESVNWCECDGNPFVGRHTVLSKKGKEYILGLIEKNAVPTEDELRVILEKNISGKDN